MNTKFRQTPLTKSFVNSRIRRWLKNARREELACPEELKAKKKKALLDLEERYLRCLRTSPNPGTLRSCYPYEVGKIKRGYACGITEEMSHTLDLMRWDAKDALKNGDTIGSWMSRWPSALGKSIHANKL